ncbi:MAG TPA: hypothetical protein VGK32_23470 [Vicinamibacterales bacterium]|jgi:hypothetical protein
MAPRRTLARGSRPTLSAADYPTPGSFFAGYLHEDFVEDHGSLEEALRAFRADADEEEQERFTRESAGLLEAAARLPYDVVAGFIRRDLGATWRPTDLAQLERLLGRSPDQAKRASGGS